MDIWSRPLTGENGEDKCEIEIISVYFNFEIIIFKNKKQIIHLVTDWFINAQLKPLDLKFYTAYFYDIDPGGTRHSS